MCLHPFFIVINGSAQPREMRAVVRFQNALQCNTLVGASYITFYALFGVLVHHRTCALMKTATRCVQWKRAQTEYCVRAAAFCRVLLQLWLLLNARRKAVCFVCLMKPQGHGCSSNDVHTSVLERPAWTIVVKLIAASSSFFCLGWVPASSRVV